MITDIVDGIIADVESGQTYGNENDGTFDVDWLVWENRFNRIIVAMHTRIPATALDMDDLDDAIARFSVVWGVRTHDKPSVGLFLIETLRIIDDAQTAKFNKDMDFDEIVR